MKGITLDRQNEDIFTFEAMKDMVLKSKVMRSAPGAQFVTNELTKNIDVKMIDKKMQSSGQ